MQLYYVPEIKSQILDLPEEEALHCIRVMRLKKGNEIHITDGKGKLCSAVIIEIEGKKCSIIVKDTVDSHEKRKYKLILAVAPTKNIDRFEWFIEKSTEIGVDEIIPVICEHSERKQVKKDRLDRIAVAAMKQSLKAYCPIIKEAESFTEVIRNVKADRKFIAVCNNPDATLLSNIECKGNDVLVLIGPEGDFSMDEIKSAINNGYTPVSLGSNRYRTETAALLACHSIYLKNLE